MQAHLSYDPHVCDLSPVSLDVAAVEASTAFPTHLFLPAYCLQTHWRQSNWEMRQIDQEMEEMLGTES